MIDYFCMVNFEIFPIINVIIIGFDSGQVYTYNHNFREFFSRERSDMLNIFIFLVHTLHSIYF